MRKDMKKVLISRPRASGLSRPVRKKINKKNWDNDVYPTKISAKRDSVGPKGDSKSQTDLIGPIRGYLEKHVGEPWDEVWSDVCKHNKDFMGYHLRQHVEWEVETNCRIENGVVVNDRGYKITNYWTRFYVHPITQTLERVPKRKIVREKKRSPIFELNGQYYYNHEGVWYRVRLENATTDYRLRWWEQKDVFGNDYFVHNGRKVYCAWKQQANSKECKQLNKMAT